LNDLIYIILLLVGMPRNDVSALSNADWPCTEMRWDMSLIILLIFPSRMLQAKLRQQRAGVLTCY